jgi:cytochrome c oxidase subunit II
MNIQWSIDQASTHAGPVDTLFLFMLALSALIALGVMAFVIFFVVKYRRGRDADRTNPIETHHKLELTWTIVPLLISLGVFVWAGRLYFQMYDVPADAMEVYVIGKQWMWKFQHPETGQVEINTLHVPVNRPVKLTMTSEDVIHSFFVPAFRIKTDALPGRYTTLWFTATEPGSYHLFCAEYCGTDHAGMIGQVIVLPEEEFQAWAGAAPVAGSGTQGAVQAGEQLFNSSGCIGCHRTDGTGVGPSLVGIFGAEVQLSTGETVVRDEAYLRTSILRPAEQLVQGYQPVMPTYEGQLGEDQLLQLIAYIESLGETPGASQQGGNQ